MICLQTKMLNIYFTDLMIMLGTWCKVHWRKIKHTLKMKDSIGMHKIEASSTQFLIKKIIHGVEFTNLYATSIEQKPEIIDTLESNYRIIRRVYQ